jgi:anthranilate synthase component 2
MTVLLVDNYDSFTWNLAHLIGELGASVRVLRNDEVTVAEACSGAFSAIVLSPGPCTPNEAGVCLPLVPAAAAARLPLLGVCLGHQSICQAYGGEVVRAKRLMHGKTSPVRHDPSTLLAGLPSPFTAARYHSLVARERSLPDAVRVTAWAEDDGEVMAVEVPGTRTFGVQFHPESIAAEGGAVLMRNFLSLAGVLRRAAA